ncbi:hypothetical protein ILYODFUR_002146 [Ilyodon furcidens]|uniref:Uncharacterized protein n=1 Tax=Ilyodon furcidens TaxID=33524 RepID=A0ABV0STZ4_9TELE
MRRQGKRKKTSEPLGRPRQPEESRFKFSAFSPLCCKLMPAEREGTSTELLGKEIVHNIFQLLSTPHFSLPLSLTLSLTPVQSLAAATPLLQALECKDRLSRGPVRQTLESVHLDL